ncbi:MAG: aminodeoxychorismate/anthranilate synthase component II [Acidimicrobiales bacterium]|nr:aminodeoxychorismate/anthranilate synthase component II [Acidimicrobiales bacterium]
MTIRRVLIIDNYDSFTYNLVQELGEIGAEPRVFRNDAIDVEEALAMAPDVVVISPGPGRPEHAGVSKEIISRLGIDHKIPVLGVCLGHQAIGEVFGGNVVQAPALMHGKISSIQHDGSGVFVGLPNPFDATRYHSLVVESRSLPDCLIVNATTSDGTIMGFHHVSLPIHGVQFHPESHFTSHGRKLLANFLETVR